MGSNGGDGKSELEGGALLNLTGDRDRSPVSINDTFYYSEAKSHPPLLGREEGVPDLLLVLEVDPTTGVGHLHHH